MALPDLRSVARVREGSHKSICCSPIAFIVRALILSLPSPISPRSPASLSPLSQTVFEPPFSPPVVGAAVVGVISIGYGLMYFGMRHQQYKQGYWK
eukprot:scaffold1143_cov198-Alexandrium_tamarense.AAC.7